MNADEIRCIESTYRVTLARYVPTIQQLDSAFERTLDVLEALWVSHALKEKEFEPWYSELRSMHAQEVRHSDLVSSCNCILRLRAVGE